MDIDLARLATALDRGAQADRWVRREVADARQLRAFSQIVRITVRLRLARMRLLREQMQAESARRRELLRRGTDDRDNGSSSPASRSF